MFQPSHIVITPLVPSTLSLVSSVVLELLRQKHHFVMLNITVIAPHLSPLTNTTTTTTPPLSPSSSSSSSPSSTENPLDTSPLLPSMALALVAAFNPSSPQNASYYNALEATVQELNAFQEVQVTGELPKEPLITWLVDMNLTSLHFPSYAFLTTSCPPPPSSSLPSFPFSSSSSSMSSTKICYLRPMEWTPGGVPWDPGPCSHRRGLSFHHPSHDPDLPTWLHLFLVQSSRLLIPHVVHPCACAGPSRVHSVWVVCRRFNPLATVPFVTTRVPYHGVHDSPLCDLHFDF
ncbi:hypothetical protein HMI55_003357 [Coelomomyces lativittatus]|nr:hypothetical protein HMI55_003357 [Coelomomyces lativittatus]